MKTTKYIKSQYGGTIVNANRNSSWLDALNTFINNSNSIQFLTSKSTLSSGKIAVLKLNPTSDSPYTSYSPDTFIHPSIGDIKSIVIKFCLLSPNLSIDDDDAILPVETTSEEIRAVSSDAFLKEVKLQQKIALDTAKDPVGLYHMATPFIIYQYDGTQSDILSDKIKLVLDKSIDTSQDEEQYIQWNSFKNQFENKKGHNKKTKEEIDIELGVIAMKFAFDNDNIENPRYKSITKKIPVLYECLRVALLCGVIHNDLSIHNYFIEEIPDNKIDGRRLKKCDDKLFKELKIDTQVKFKWWKMRAILIDWGEVIEVDPCNICKDPKEWENAGKDLDSGKQLFKELIENIKKIDSDNEVINSIQDNEKEKITEYLAIYHRLCYLATQDNNKKIIKETFYPFVPANFPANFSSVFTKQERLIFEKLEPPKGTIVTRPRTSSISRTSLRPRSRTRTRTRSRSRTSSSSRSSSSSSSRSSSRGSGKKRPTKKRAIKSS